MATIADVCTKDRLIRSNYYSDTYRAKFTLKGVKQEWDVQHIGIPFPPVKEIELKARFGLSDSDLQKYYLGFGSNVKHHIDMIEALKNLGDTNVDKSTPYYEKVSIFRRENDAGSDIYIISEPAEALVGSSVIQNNASTLHNILSLGTRLLQTIKTYNDRGFCVGAIDLDSFVTVQSDGRMIVKDNYFFFGTGEGNAVPVLTPDAGTFMPQSVITGKKQVSPDSDIEALCALLWTMLDGKHYTDSPDFSKSPKYAAPGIVQALLNGLQNGTEARSELNKALREALRTTQDGVIRFSEPSYAQKQRSAVAEYLQYHSAEIDNNDDEDDDENEYDEDEELEEDPTIFTDRMSKKQKVLTVFSSALLSGLILAGSLFGGKYLGEQGWGAVAMPRPTGTPEATAEVIESEPEHTIATPMPMQTMRPIQDTEIPVLNLDKEYDWFRSEYPADDFCAIVFQDTYENEVELVEKWNFALGDDSIMCYVYARPKFKTGINCSTDGGDKVLVITGNGSGKIKVAMTQRQLVEYMQYKFTYGVLNGLSTLMSTGSTPFTVPTPTPEIPIPTDPPIEVIETPEPIETPFPTPTPYVDNSGYYPVQSSGQNYSNYSGSNTGVSSSGTYGNNGGGGNSGGTSYSGSSTAPVVPDWNSQDWTVTGSWGSSGGGTPVSGGVSSDSGSTANSGDFTVVTHTFALEGKNVMCTIGSTTGVKLTGDVAGAVRIWSSDTSKATVASSPDSSGWYLVNCIGRGTVEIFGSCDWGTAVLTIMIS